jgi:hypothetical protein
MSQQFETPNRATSILDIWSQLVYLVYRFETSTGQIVCPDAHRTFPSPDMPHGPRFSGDQVLDRRAVT